LGPPNVGGARTVQGLNLLQCADLPQFGHFANSPKSLYYMVQIVNVIGLLESLPPERCAQSFPGIDLPGPLRINKTTGKAVWAKIRAPGWNDQIRELAASESAGNNDMGADSLGAEHSDALIAVDDRGDIAVLEHTINTASWGTTGIFVDGISIPDSGALNQKSIKEAGPGARVPDATHPLLILKGKNPYLACGSIGGGMYEVTLQNVVNVLDFGMSPKTAADAPCILQCGGPARPQPFPIGDFSDTVLNALQALGQDVKLVTKEEQGLLRGYWVGVRIDPVTGKLEGAAPKLLNGCAMGY
jgi:gamma-glutamyltranspeptidase/glutathione hydrolase